MNILDYYERKVAILERFESGKIDGQETLESLRELNSTALTSGLTVSDVISAEMLLDVRKDSDLSFSEATDETSDDNSYDEDESYDDSYSLY